MPDSDTVLKTLAELRKIHLQLEAESALLTARLERNKVSLREVQYRISAALASEAGRE